MPWCPKCRTEYEEGYKVCTDCGSELEEKIEEEAFDHEVYLTTASDSLEADYLEAVLKEHHIPVMRKYRESGAYLNIIMGNTVMGIDLYVPASSLEAAKELINFDLNTDNGQNIPENTEDSEDTENTEKGESDEIAEDAGIADLSNEEAAKQKKRFWRALLILLALLLVLFLIYLLKSDSFC